jgi:aromatic-L-amino-acid decarboxylase
MNSKTFRRDAHEVVDWLADYLDKVEDYPVMARVSPGDISAKLPGEAPGQAEPFKRLMEDLEQIIMPGITHWQHPSFFAYFPANSSPPSVLAEMITAGLAVQGMVWQTSPSATELEEVVIKWLVQMLGLPGEFTGVLQDTASTATLCSLLSARERASAYAVNDAGFTGQERYTCYCSEEAHSSVEKAVKIAGIGRRNLRRIPTDKAMAMDADALEAAIHRDRSQGFHPLWITATLGTTGSTAVDPLARIAEITRREGLWLHVDAALAGTALILPEMRWMADGVTGADSFVFNPHKWMFTNFDCSVYLVQDPAALVQTFEISPEYLKTAVDDRVHNYRDWGIQLGRRFRALKLWFVIRSYGIGGLQQAIRAHITMAARLARLIEAETDFGLLAPVPLNTVCFRYQPQGLGDENRLEALNRRILEAVNRSGQIFITHTKLKGCYALRLVVGQTRVEWRHVEAAWELIRKTATELGKESDGSD